MELTETTLNLKLSELDNELSFPLDDLFFLEITDDTHRTEIKYEFLIRFSSINTNLIVFGNAAYKPQEIKVEPPIFMRHSWEKQFQESVIYFYDPTIYNYPEYGVGWGVGDDVGWYLQNIARIISILAQKIKVANENILFVGSSAGGFMALALSTLLKESSALVNNPQIDLRKHREIIDSISDYYFNKQNKEEILSKLAYRFDVVELFKKEKYMPNITYCCNVDSNPDLNVDLQYLITETSKLKEEYFNYPDVNVVLYSHPNGHSGLLDQERQIHMIKEHFKVSFKEKSMSSLYIDMGGGI